MCDQSHNDFVHGLSWQEGVSILSCGWDGKIHRHCYRELLNMSKEETVDVTIENNDTEKENQCIKVHKDVMLESSEEIKMDVAQRTSINGLNRDIVMEHR